MPKRRDRPGRRRHRGKTGHVLNLGTPQDEAKWGRLLALTGHVAPYFTGSSLRESRRYRDALAVIKCYQRHHDLRLVMIEMKRLVNERPMTRQERWRTKR